MKVALIGYGRMGRAIDAIAEECGHSIVARIDPQARDATAPAITEESVNSADVCIEFTHPAAVLGNIRKLVAMKKPVVVGTSGWYNHLETVAQLCQAEGVGVLYAQNFSVGMTVFSQIVAHAAQIVDAFDDYDVSMLEYHHRGKADSPSGTAELLADILLRNSGRKDVVCYDRVNRQIGSDELHVASVRCGHIPGTHSVVFDSSMDTITLTHEARNRLGWARGALLAAGWIEGKKGLYSIDEMVGDLAGAHRQRIASAVAEEN